MTIGDGNWKGRMKMPDDRLKPCPFCGSEAKMKSIVYPFMTLCWVRCENCNAEINNPRNNVEDAIEDWNRRINDA